MVGAFQKIDPISRDRFELCRRLKNTQRTLPHEPWESSTTKVILYLAHWKCFWHAAIQNDEEGRLTDRDKTHWDCPFLVKVSTSGVVMVVGRLSPRRVLVGMLFDGLEDVKKSNRTSTRTDPSCSELGDHQRSNFSVHKVQQRTGTHGQHTTSL